MADLKPCPFCGSDDLGHAYTADRVFIRCGSCGSGGPHCIYVHSRFRSLSEAELLAEKRWNDCKGTLAHVGI